MYLTKAPTLTILIPVTDENGVLRFPHSGGPYYGIHKIINAAVTLSAQAEETAKTFFNSPNATFTPVAAIDPVLKKSGEVSSVLYLMKPTSKDLPINKNWPTMAEILRAVDPGPTRLAYMKALQHLAGAADAQVDVLEVDEEVRTRLKTLEEDLPN
ncbi:MAG: hypothetical protein EOP10_13670 [Proteobacteria bacterium]|nr:MAG: hypothetical protein EOP10_13670 [Pseudomonadota bacterium]